MEKICSYLRGTLLCTFSQIILYSTFAIDIIPRSLCIELTIDISLHFYNRHFPRSLCIACNIYNRFTISSHARAPDNEKTRPCFSRSIRMLPRNRLDPYFWEDQNSFHHSELNFQHPYKPIIEIYFKVSSILKYN